MNVTHVFYIIPFDVYAPVRNGEYDTSDFGTVADNLATLVKTEYPYAGVQILIDHSEYMQKDFHAEGRSLNMTELSEDDLWSIRETVESLVPTAIEQAGIDYTDSEEG